MSAGRHKRALWTSAVDQELSLEIDSRPFQFLESLFLQQLPNVILVQAGAPGDQFALI